MTEKLEQIAPALEKADGLSDAAQVAVFAYAQGLSAAAKMIAANKEEGSNNVEE